MALGLVFRNNACGLNQNWVFEFLSGFHFSKINVCLKFLLCSTVGLIETVRFFLKRNCTLFRNYACGLNHNWVFECLSGFHFSKINVCLKFLLRSTVGLIETFPFVPKKICTLFRNYACGSNQNWVFEFWISFFFDMHFF